MSISFIISRRTRTICLVPQNHFHTCHAALPGFPCSTNCNLHVLLHAVVSSFMKGTCRCFPVGSAVSATVVAFRHNLQQLISVVSLLSNCSDLHAMSIRQSSSSHCSGGVIALSDSIHASMVARHCLIDSSSLLSKCGARVLTSMRNDCPNPVCASAKR